MGIFLIVYNLDLNAIILWIIYGGLCIIFFIFSLIWFEIFKNYYKISQIRGNFYLIVLLLSIIIYYLINLNVLNFEFYLKNNLYISYYKFILKSNLRELEMLGWGLIFYSTFIFLIISYSLLLNCLIIIIIINNSKKIKNNLINNYLIFFIKNKDIFYLNYIKNQKFFIQDYENTYQQNTIIKNFKIINLSHKINNIQGRV